MEVLNFILPIVYIVVGAALVWFIVELVITIRKVRGEALTTLDDLKPTINEVQGMVTELQPVVKKVDPLVDRVTLTVDSVNLEMMRVDAILEDVTTMTDALSKTVNVVDNVTSVPVDLVNTVTKKVRKKLRPKYASDESVAAGLNAASEAPSNPLIDLADAAVSVAGEVIKQKQAKNATRTATPQAEEAPQAGDEQAVPAGEAPASEAPAAEVATQAAEAAASEAATQVSENLGDAAGEGTPRK